jgi:predicted nuclease of predicted toxin-antitoxin system
MRFLVDEDLPLSTCDLLQFYGYEAINIRDVGLRGAKDSQIASFAQNNGLCLLTGDYDFSDVRNYPPSQYKGIIVLGVPKDATASIILNLLESFLQQDELVLGLPGKLAIVKPGRIRIRKDL